MGAHATPRKGGSEKKRPRKEKSVKSTPKKRNSKGTIKKGQSKKPRVEVSHGSPGDLVLGRVVDGGNFGPPSIAIKLAANSFGRVCITQIDDNDAWTDKALEQYPTGKFVQCVLLHPRAKGDYSAVELSLRPSLVDASISAKERKKRVNAEKKETSELPEVGALVKGFVATTSKSGCFVRLSRDVTARVGLKDLSDRYVAEPSKEFPPGKLVAGRVVSVNQEKGLIDLSLKSSVVVGQSAQKWNWETLRKGAKLSGSVRRVEKFGVFVNLDESSNLSGLCHISELADRRVNDINQEYNVGDPVKVVVLDVDTEKKRIALGMKPSYFEEGVEEESDSDSEDEEMDTGDNIGHNDSESDEEEEKPKLKVLEAMDEDSDSEDETIEQIVAKENADEESSSEDEESSSEDSDSDASDAKGDGPSLKEALNKLKKGDGNASESEEEESDDDDEDQAGSKHKTAREREHLRKRKEAETSAREAARLENGDVAETSEDFERLLLTSPNSSELWISYMSMRISETNISGARAVAERALRTISFREEEEKLNVWVALLNLEQEYGDQEAFDAVVKRMVQQNDPKVAYLKLAEMHVQGERFDAASEAFKKCIKVTKGESKVAFLEFIKFRFDIDDAAGARDLLKDALKRLPLDKYVDTVVKFARLEFSHEHGDQERGRTLLEGLLDNHPKRTDVWHQYIDMEVKFGDINKARRLHERVTTIKVSARKMKTFFKKWLTFETVHGTSEQAEHVKNKAREFVESLGA